jgi:hypothetical protein
MSYIQIFPVVPNIGALGKVIFKCVSGFIFRVLFAGKYSTVFDEAEEVCAYVVSVRDGNKRIKAKVMLTVTKNS